MYKIAIDGPSGAGKSTISQRLARELSFIYIDTGAMYRACGLKCLRNGIDIKKNPEAAISAVENIVIDIDYANDGTQLIFLDGKNVTGFIRTPEVSAYASDVSAIKEVRLKLVALQRELARAHNVIMDGRDIGTYVLPDAQVKIFLTADNDERAKRRYAELCEKGADVKYEDVLQDMIKRDRNDSTRAFAPLKPAEDSIIVDTTQLDFEQSVKKIRSLIEERLNNA